MAEIMDDVVHLSQEIGPHPAGTDEEQQAALYLAEEIQKESGFTTVIEDFQCVTNYLIPTFVCFGLALVAVIISIVLPIAVIPCFIAVVIAAVLFGLEVFNKPVLSRFLRTGASQNIVAKYQPTPMGGVTRRRKVILVANYDTGKVLKEEELPVAGILPILNKASVIALAVAAVVLFFRMTIFATDTGAMSSILVFLLVICAILFVIPLARAGMHMVAPYSQSANNNAAGVSVLLDVARQVGNGLVSNEEALERAKQEGNYVHGESAARAAGVVPEGASLEYDSNLSPQESLAAAKAAIAALTGKPVADKVPVTDISSRLVKGGGLEPVDEEAVSSVHFEVSETPQVAPRKQDRFRTMISMDEEADANEAAAPSPRSRVEEYEQAENESQVVSQESEAIQTDEQPLQTADSYSDTSSFERPAPMSVVENISYASAPIDRTPAWAKAAQEKARKNKPEESQPHKVSRSRYADTVAAHLMETQNERQRELEDRFTQQVDSLSEPVSENPELASRLAALRSEIESTEAPHISDSTQTVLDSMGTSTELAPEPAVASAVTPEAPAQSAARAQSSVSEQSEQPAARNTEVLEQSFEETDVSALTSADTFEADEVIPKEAEVKQIQDKQQKKRTGHSLSQSVRKSVAGPHAFASRLKSITSRTPDTTSEPEEVLESQATEPQVSQAQSAEADIKEKTASFGSVNTTQATEEEKAAVASPGETAAISPIDVSQFMNKEQFDEADLAEEDAFEDRDIYGDVDNYVPQPLVQQPLNQHALDAEETQKVSSEQIQEAIQEASAHEPVIEPRAEKEDSVQVASPIMGMETMIPQIPSADEIEAEHHAKRQVIVLPDVVAPHAASGEGAKQRAPMAETNESTKAGSKALLSNMLPRIGDTNSSAPVEVEQKDTFGLNLPSLDASAPANTAVSATGSFSTVGGTGSFAPVGDELVADVAPEERYIDDADDSAYDEDYTETGAYAGRGYVDMPKSRAGRLFGRFRKKKNKQEDVSVNDWVDVDDSYDARSVGKARGDWSSFRQDEGTAPTAGSTTKAPAANNDGFVDIDYHDTDFDNRRGWNGGAFSLSRLKKFQNKADDYVPEEQDVLHDEVMDAVDPVEDDFVEVNPSIRIDGDVTTAEQINRELRKLQDFRHPDIDTEVWFVALGAEQYSHSGITAFLDEHADEMKGAVIINLEALGAGTLSVIDQESETFKTHRPSSRIKRFVRQASERSGVTYHATPLTRRETPATIAMSRGVQAFTVAGMGDGNTALYSAENDIVENLDPEALKEASKFIMAVLKSI
ncbi:putative uncharacterized protein [Eggerthella sp. CAG:1427]|nr:putative uncharacterized protein [Eggerthella sp. CAG:1427]